VRKTLFCLSVLVLTTLLNCQGSDTNEDESESWVLDPNAPIPYLPFDREDWPDNMSGYFSNANIEDTFKDDLDLISELTEEEKIMVGDWRCYDCEDIDVSLTQSMNIPYYNFQFFPNKVVEIRIEPQDGTRDRLRALHGTWRIEDGAVIIDLQAYEWSSEGKTVTMIEPYPIKFADLDTIDPSGYTVYRIQPIQLPDEIELQTGFKETNYRPFLYRILRRQYPGLEPEGFYMNLNLDKMRASGLDGRNGDFSEQALKMYLEIE
jgi:hypothetical protein